MGGGLSDREEAIARSSMTEYIVIYERGEGGWGAYSPDVPGCIATGRSQADVELRFKQALEFHLEGLRLEGLPLPVPRSEVGRVRVEVAA